MGKWGNNALCLKRPYPLSCADEVTVESPFNFRACKIQSCIYLPELSLMLAKESRLDSAKPAPLPPVLSLFIHLICEFTLSTGKFSGVNFNVMFYGFVFIENSPHSWSQQFIEYTWLLWTTRAHVGTNIYLTFPEYLQLLSRSLPFPKETHLLPCFLHHLTDMAVQVFQLLKVFQMSGHPLGPPHRTALERKRLLWGLQLGFESNI